MPVLAASFSPPTDIMTVGAVPVITAKAVVVADPGDPLNLVTITTNGDDAVTIERDVRGTIRSKTILIHNLAAWASRVRHLVDKRLSGKKTGNVYWLGRDPNFVFEITDKTWLDALVALAQTKPQYLVVDDVIYPGDP